ncbi:hypothetical protein BJ944DRAFT_197765 [Cunninghamella echinulata]|nr:hypothetical protein BJ944DRAFT_197765 [Cunninghamella echinulata]
METEGLDSVAKIYVNGEYHCDWRLILYGCEEEKGAYIINMINIAISGLAILIGTAILTDRMIIKGHRLFEFGSAKGWLRPMPIDCMLFFLTIFNILRLITSVLLITNTARNNWIARSFTYEIAWQFGYGSFALYLIGIAQTLADSHKAISSGWLPSPKTVDFIGGTFFFAPFLLNNVCSLATGILAKSNIPVAIIFIRILYILWFIHCGSLGTAVLLAGWRLIRILNQHLAKFHHSGSGERRATSIQNGIFKIKAVVIIIAICLYLFATFLLLYGALRDQIMTSTVGSLILSGIWNWLGALTTLAAQAAILFNPPTNGVSFFGFKTSSNNGQGKTASDSGNEKGTDNGSRGMYDTHFSHYTNGQQEHSFHGTLSKNAFDELKLQQLEYQKSTGMMYPNNHSSQIGHDMDDDLYDSNPSPAPTILTSQAGIPLEDIEYHGKVSSIGLIQPHHSH